MSLLIAILGTAAFFVMSVFVAKPCSCGGERSCASCPFGEIRNEP
ncbi:MAG: hypothetical protein ACYTGN_11120 [Planctomycetota bacterium]|jgi:hypothetical protein